MYEKRVRGALGAAALSLMVGACTDGAPAANTEDANLQKASANLSAGQKVIAADSDAVPTFLTGSFGSVPAPSAIQGIAAQQQLAPVLANVAPLFRLNANDLFLKRAYVGFDGDTHFRYGVTQNGILVQDAELRLHARNGSVFAVNTNARGDLKGELKASIASDAAIAAAIGDRGSPERASSNAEPQLVYRRSGNELILAYEVRVQGELKDTTPVDDSVYVNAKTGDVFERVPHIHSAKNREVWDLQHRTSLPTAVKGRFEGEAAVADPVINNNYDHLGTVYDCYSNLFGRDSYDNAGKVLKSYVHYSNNYVNAYWDGTQMVYGDGDGVNASNLANSLDVTAHELTHAVTEYESNLTYSGESGGLNESISDIFGAVCEWYGKGKVIDDGTWIVGDDVWTPNIPGDGLRYMNNPTQDGDSLDYYPDYGSGVDVHYSSGISNLAFYLMSQGGTHPRAKTTQVVNGIGFEKAAKVFYKINADLLTASSNFEAAKTASEQAATQLGFTAAEIADVGNAWKAVGVGVPVPPPVTTPIEKGVPVTGINGTSGSKVYYSVTIPEGATDVTFTMSGGTGDADLYVRKNNAPTDSLYDCRPYKSGNAETCTFATSGAKGIWYVMIKGFTSYTGTSLSVTWKGGFEDIGNETRIEGLSGVPGSSRTFIIDMPEFKKDSGINTLSIALGEGEGNADVYVQAASAPTFTSYLGRGVRESATESVILRNIPAGKYYITVVGVPSLVDTEVDGYINTVFAASYKVK
ncbi:matrix-associated zinc metalloprotease FibA [Corallococcus coralloides]|uniref:Matrix-associated zinc metalloprotease FibA n=1 Tax=Corallococcus coralloides TaxID=184914 RepID=A0A410S0Y3_CORCK|nr:M4 family metallopeptidase [Corallococcus coralloides]QAT87869.1 matrix-associated zinc metalloprotease FibA [Corallococcus coralloides]